MGTKWPFARSLQSHEDCACSQTICTWRVFRPTPCGSDCGSGSIALRLTTWSAYDQQWFVRPSVRQSVDPDVRHPRTSRSPSLDHNVDICCYVRHVRQRTSCRRHSSGSTRRFPTWQRLSSTEADAAQILRWSEAVAISQSVSHMFSSTAIATRE